MFTLELPLRTGCTTSNNDHISVQLNGDLNRVQRAFSHGPLIYLRVSGVHGLALSRGGATKIVTELRSGSNLNSVQAIVLRFGGC